MRIAILARGLYRPGGVSRILSGLVTHLPSSDAESEFAILTDSPLPNALKAGNVLEVLLPKTNPAVFDHFHVPRAVRRIEPDVLLAPKNTVPARLSCPAACMFLDLAYFAMPEAYPLLDNIYMRAMFRRSARRAARIIAISRSTRQDVKRFLSPEAYEKTSVIYPGLKDNLSELSEERKRDAREHRRDLPERFVLYPGNISPRKNLLCLFEAFREIDRDTALLITGHRSWNSRGLDGALSTLAETHDVRVLGYTDEEELTLLYNLAEVICYPSLYEGFGFPVLEGFACGTPVVASNATSIPEVAGDAALLFDPHDKMALRDALKQVLADGVLREEMRRKGLERAKEFTWNKASAAILETLREAV